MSTSVRRPATLSPVPPAPVFPRVLRYLSLGLSFYVCILCVGFGVYQYTFASVPAYRTLGVDIKAVAKELRDHDDLGPVVAGREECEARAAAPFCRLFKLPALAAVAAEARMSSALFIAVRNGRGCWSGSAGGQV
jgi:hypothetical protein